MLAPTTGASQYIYICQYKIENIQPHSQTSCRVDLGLITEQNINELMEEVPVIQWNH